MAPPHTEIVCLLVLCEAYSILLPSTHRERDHLIIAVAAQTHPAAPGKHCAPQSRWRMRCLRRNMQSVRRHTQQHLGSIALLGPGGGRDHCAAEEVCAGHCRKSKIECPWLLTFLFFLGPFLTPVSVKKDTILMTRLNSISTLPPVCQSWCVYVHTRRCARMVSFFTGLATG